jgi:ribosomal 50S subunit-recycling heat shock protein
MLLLWASLYAVPGSCECGAETGCRERRRGSAAERRKRAASVAPAWHGAKADGKSVEPPFVRLDKFMKVARLSKRRSEAHEALEHGRISKDGKSLKPGYQVKAGDVLEIHYATKFVTVRVREVPLRVTPGVNPAALYEILDTRKDEPSEWI